MPRGATLTKGRQYISKRDPVYIKQESPQIMNLTSIYSQPNHTSIGSQSNDFFHQHFDQTTIQFEGHTPNNSTASAFFTDFQDVKPVLGRPQVTPFYAKQIVIVSLCNRRLKHYLHFLSLSKLFSFHSRTNWIYEYLLGILILHPYMYVL